MESSVKWMRHISRASQSVRFFACPVSESSATARCVGCSLLRFHAHAHAARAAAPPPPSPPLARALFPPRSNFFFAHYNHVKTLAPNFAFQIRHTGEEPYMMVEYDFGETAKIGLSGLKEADIVAKVRASFSRPVRPHRQRARADPLPPLPRPAPPQLEQAVSIGAAMPRSDNQSGAPRLEANILPSVVE
jgi:hypothetical protein